MQCLDVLIHVKPFKRLDLRLTWVIQPHTVWGKVWLEYQTEGYC